MSFCSKLFQKTKIGQENQVGASRKAQSTYEFQFCGKSIRGIHNTHRSAKKIRTSIHRVFKILYLNVDPFVYCDFWSDNPLFDMRNI